MSARALASGESPFWIEGEHCGHPALLRQEVSLFYPPTLALLLTGAPAHRMADFFSLFHFWLAGLAAYLFLREARCGVGAALFGGAAWMLSARMIQSALWPNAVAVGALLPLVLAGMLRIGRRERRSGLLWTALSGGLLLLAFRPQVLVGAWPLLVAIGAFSVASSPDRRAAFVELLGASGLAVLLAAPALVTSSALVPSSSRAGGLTAEERDVSRVTPAELAGALRPDVGTRPETAIYTGVVVALLFVAGIVLAVRKEGFPRALFASLAVAAVVGLLFALGGEGPYRLISDLPLLRGFRVPARYLVSFSLAVVLGSALALNALAFAKTTASRVLPIAAIVLVAIDLGAYAWRHAPLAPAAIYENEPDVVRLLRERLGADSLGFPRRFLAATAPGFEYLTGGLSMIRNFDVAFGAGMRYGVENAQGQLGPGLRRTLELFARPSRRTAELAGVGTIVTFLPENRFDFRALPALPRAILVGETASSMSPQLDPRTTAVLEDAEPFARGSSWDPARASLRLLSREPGRIELAAALPDRGALVVFESFESGWRADVGGRAAPVVPADGAFLGVVLPAGDHRVRLRYVPPGLAAGLGLFAVGVLGVLLTATRMAGKPA